jgi:prolyl oligopeptidase
MFGKLNYPKTRKVDIEDDFFGATVPDPYRWLENADDPEVLAWTQTQHDFVEEILGGLPARDSFRQRLTAVWDYPKYGAVPRKVNGRFFFTKNDGLQAQAILYVWDEGKEPRVLIDPNTFSDDGTMSMLDWQPSSDGNLMMYGISESGLDWRTFKIRDVDTGQDLDDTLSHIKFSSVSWRKDGSGFFYSRFPETVQDEGEGNQAVSHQVYFHTLGTAQTDDQFIYEHPELKGLTLGAQVSDDDCYLVLYVAGDSFVYNRLYYREIDSEGDFVRLFDALDAAYEFIGNDSDTFYIATTKNSPNKRVVALDLKNPDAWRDVVPESDDVIAGVTMANQQFVVTYMHHAQHIIKVFGKAGNFVRDIPMPTIGSVALFAGAASKPEDTEIFIPYMSFLRPITVYQYDFKTNLLSSVFEVEVPQFNPDDYETRQVFYQSKDGTTVPMFVTAKKGLPLKGDNPTILYGYGGYDISLTPVYPSWLPLWLERGGVYVVANLRGGGEYGEKWHLAGMLEHKQNTFDDFHAAAEWLIANDYTSSKKLAIEGGSNGGLLVAVAMIQRPELYGAVLCHVPVIDMLRFQHFTAGRYWTSEYGDANSAKEHFDFLFDYSPLHNIKPNTKYPPLLIMTADHDDRVVPMHSKKFAAALQEADSSNNVILLRIETKAGHGLGKPTAKMIDERVDVFAFLNALFEMGVK